MAKGSDIAKSIDNMYRRKKYYEEKLKKNMPRNNENKKIDNFSKK